jgi:hypothetical protein
MPDVNGDLQAVIALSFVWHVGTPGLSAPFVRDVAEVLGIPMAETPFRLTPW